MAIRFKQVTPEQWHLERIRPVDVSKRHKNYDGQVMFPSSHDITSNNIDACLEVLKNLLDVGNQVLVVSKPHLECIKRICDEFEQFKDQILFRFSIGWDQRLRFHPILSVKISATKAPRRSLAWRSHVKAAGIVP